MTRRYAHTNLYCHGCCRRLQVKIRDTSLAGVANRLGSTEATIVNIFACVPVHAFWKPLEKPFAKCIDQNMYVCCS